MDYTDLLVIADHTNLNQTAVWADIQALCDDAIAYGTASVCIAPAFVKQAKDYVGDKMAVCTVIGFPNGYATTATKVFETQDALANGADEIDMVIHIGQAKAQHWADIQGEIQVVKAVCGDKILKVIIETCLLSREEKIQMCHVVTAAGADYIKTSTGFSTAGATPEDIEIFSQYVGDKVKIKAAGGIKTLDDARLFKDMGASRLGTSKVVNLVKNIPAEGY